MIKRSPGARCFRWHAFFYALSNFVLFILSACSPQIIMPKGLVDELNKSFPLSPPSLISLIPVSPSSSTLTPVIVGSVSGLLESESLRTEIRLYSNSACSGSTLGDGTYADFSSAGISVVVSANTLTPIYGQTYHPIQGLSQCALLASYRHDSVAPVLSISTPANAETVGQSSLTGYSVSGLCSTADVGLTVVLTGSVSGSATCDSNGTWSVSLDYSGLPDGPLSVTANLTDQAGNSAPPVTINFFKDSSAPSGGSLVLDGGASVTNQASVALTLSASGATEMYISNSGSCASGGAWEPYDTSKAAWPHGASNAVATVYVKYRNALGNESACVSASITHDSLAPTVSITSPTSASLILLANVTSFTVSGACSENGRSVVYAASSSGGGTPITGIINCTTLAWSHDFDLSSLPDGTISVTADHTDLAGNAAAQATRSFTKDTSAPNSHAIVIAGGASHTKLANVSLTLSATGAQDMYVTNTSGCTSGGSWESYATSKTSWAHGASNSTATVYVKFRNASLNESSCVSDSIIHDSIAPTLSITSPGADGDGVNTGNMSAITISGACNESGGTVILSGDVSTTAACDGTSWSKTLDFSSLSDGTITVSADLQDAATNSANTVTRTWTKSTSGPTGGSISIAGGAGYTNQANVPLTLSASGAAEMYVTNTLGCESGGSWELYDTSKASWAHGVTNATATVYVKYRDAGSNESACYSDDIIHDSIAPTVTLDAAPAASVVISNANVSAFTISGTCSEINRSVELTFNDSALSATPTCSGSNTWSDTVDLSELTDGPIALSLAQTDAAGNPSTVVTRTWTKDTQAPTGGLVSIANGATYTNQANVALTLSASGAAEMYVTNTLGCESGGSWELYDTSKASWAHGVTNATATVYTKYRDAALNESACVNDTIIHDSINPTAPSSLILGSVPSDLTSTPTISWTASTDSSSGVSHYQVQVLKASDSSVVVNWTTLVSGNALSSISLEGATAYFARVRAVDAAGNAGSYGQSSNWTSAEDTTTCTGSLVGGYCWHVATASSTSCNSLCTGKGGVHPATTYYAGSHGTNAACEAVMDAFGYTSNFVFSSSGPAPGCGLGNTGHYYRSAFNTDYSIGASGMGSNARRACACAFGSGTVLGATDPDNLTLMSKNSSNIALRWQRPAEEAGTTGYRIAYSTGATPPADCSSAQITEGQIPQGYDSTEYLRHTITGLDLNTAYSIRVCGTASGAPSVSTGVTLVNEMTQSYDVAARSRAPEYSSTTSAESAAASVTYSHTTSGTDRFLIVGVGRYSSLPTVNSVTYDGVALTRLGRQGTSDPIEVWYLINPSLGTANVEVQLANAISPSWGSFATSFTGVDQTTPFTTFYANTSSSAGSSLDTFQSGGLDDNLIVGLINMQYGTISSSYQLRATPTMWSQVFKIWTTPGESDILLQWNDSGWAAYVLSLRPSQL